MNVELQGQAENDLLSYDVIVATIYIYIYI